MSHAPKPSSAAAKWVYVFGAGQNDGDAGMKNLLGGKGANLAEMASLGLPVPPGFTITTEVCTAYYANGRSWPAGLEQQANAALAWAPHSVTLRTRCWSRCARARVRRCRA
jgi:pyruvate, orthophosphate dikinase